MRIRQRKVPHPLSCLSPAPVSDPPLSRSQVVQLQLHKNPHPNIFQEDDTDSYYDSQPYQQNNSQDCSDGAEVGPQEEKKVCLMDEKEERAEKKSYASRKRSNLVEILQHSVCSHQDIGSWYEGENAFPLKRRRGLGGRSSELKTTLLEKGKKTRTKMKTKVNKNYVEQVDMKEGYDREAKEGSDGGSDVKIRARGSALLEGSRCSRVNGRGWRCWQQTLVGYSLCEHHLGKGKLRSMSSVRSQPIGSRGASKKDESMPLSRSSLQAKVMSLDDNNRVGGLDEDRIEKELSAASKNKMKLGMVKARSMRSLLA